MPQATSSLPSYTAQDSHLWGGGHGRKPAVPKIIFLYSHLWSEGRMYLRFLLTKPKIFRSYRAKSNKTKNWLLFYLVAVKGHLMSALSSSLNTFITTHKPSRSFTEVWSKRNPEQTQTALKGTTCFPAKADGKYEFNRAKKRSRGNVTENEGKRTTTSTLGAPESPNTKPCWKTTGGMWGSWSEHWSLHWHIKGFYTKISKTQATEQKKYISFILTLSSTPH